MPDRESLELERYELSEGPAYSFANNRRDFLKLIGGGIAIFLALDTEMDAQESGARGRRGGRGDAFPENIGAWLHIAQDGAITVFTGKAEMGQNIRTSLTQAVAEELHCKPETIQLTMADTALTPFDMGTFGSRTTPTMAPQLHRVGAAAREMLLDLAAAKWNVDKTSLTVADRHVKNSATGESLSFAQLTNGQQLSKTISPDLKTTPAAQWQIAGHDHKKINAREIVTGAHRYASDVRRDGMLYGKVVRPPAFNSTLTSVDTKPAEAISGITVVHDGNFIGVASSDPQKLTQAAAAIRAQWNSPQQPSSRELFSYLKTHPAEANRGGAETNRTDEGLKNADAKLEATYTVAYIAHTPLEPRAAVAEWNGANLTVWTGSQRPFGVRSELAQVFGIPESQVRVIVPDTGSAYGGKHTGEAAIEAARLAKAAGKPVKLVWTREEEFTWAYFRPAGVIDVRSGARKDGTITAWEFHNYNSGPSALRSSYHIPNEVTEFHPAQSPLRQGSYRGLAATANHFARESHMDELAHAIGMDPLAFRLKNTTDARLRRVFATAAERFGWGKVSKTPGKGFGIAGGFEKGGYVACCVEVTMPSGARKVKIERVVEAWDSGPAVNPEQLKNQIEGAIVMGLGGALFEAIEFNNGRVLNPKLSQYRVPRFSDVPKIEAVLIDPKDVPAAGAGETPIVGIAPALANAIFNATGNRIRSMPMKVG